MSNVLVPRANGCEELEAITITDLLVRAGIEVTTAALDNQPVKASRGTTIIADTTIDQIINKSYDLVVLPGGLPGADNLRDDERVQTILKNHSKQDKYIAAICAAPKALAAAGLLENKNATAYPGTLEPLNLENTTIKTTAIEIDGKIITSRGPGTSLDFALMLIQLLEGEATRNKVEKGLCR